MATFTLSASGTRGVDDAWGRYADPSRWPEWSPQVRTVTASADRLAVGVTGRLTSWAGVSVPFRVTAYDEASRTWSWQVGWSLLRVALDHAVLRIDSGSETTLRIRGPLVLITPYLPLAQLALRRLVQA